VGWLVAWLFGVLFRVTVALWWCDGDHDLYLLLS
jgi:hypothetical protein